MTNSPWQLRPPSSPAVGPQLWDPCTPAPCWPQGPLTPRSSLPGLHTYLPVIELHVIPFVVSLEREKGSYSPVTFPQGRWAHPRREPRTVHKGAQVPSSCDNTPREPRAILPALPPLPESPKRLPLHVDPGRASSQSLGTGDTEKRGFGGWRDGQ